MICMSTFSPMSIDEMYVHGGYSWCWEFYKIIHGFVLSVTMIMFRILMISISVDAAV